MRRTRLNRPLAAIAAVAFIVAAALNWWIVVAEGGRGVRLASAIGFTAVAAIWIVNAVLAGRRTRGDDKERS